MIKKLDYLPVVAKLIRGNIGFKARDIVRAKRLWNRGTGVLDRRSAGGLLGNRLAELWHGHGEGGAGSRCQRYGQSGGRAQGECANCRAEFIPIVQRGNLSLVTNSHA